MRLPCVLLALSVALSLPRNVYAQTCSSLSVSDCIGLGSASSGCKFDFDQNVCYSGTALDTCQAETLKAPCQTAGCFWDPYLTKCLASLSQATWAFTCPYWQQSAFLVVDQQGAGTSSPACMYHGCAFDATSKVCSVITTGGIIPVSSPTVPYSQTVQFLNPLVTLNSLEFTLDITAGVYQNPENPRWGTIQLLSSRTGLQEWSTEVNATCSSFDSRAAAGPVGFVGTPLSTSDLAANFANYQFPSNELGQTLTKEFGYMRVGQGLLVDAVTSDGTLITHKVKMNLNTINAECLQRGVTSVEISTGRVYTVPISYVERGLGNSYLQTTQVYTISVLTSGQISIATTAPSHQRVFPLEIVYPETDCGADRARQRITWQLFVQDQYNPTSVVGPRSIADLSIPPNSNCYGDELSSFVATGCFNTTNTCSYQFTTLSKCRSKTADGEAFKQCSYADDADRIAELGSDIPYNTALNGIHKVAINSYTCSSVGGVCTLTNSNPSNQPDVVSALILSSEYLRVESSVNPFQVTGGFLPTPTSSVGSYVALTDALGNVFNTSMFDGNIFSNQPVNVLLLLPPTIQQFNDLRIQIMPTDTTIYALDSQANRLSSVPSVDWATIAPYVLYTTKNAFDNSCGAAGTCNKMPACTSILGCDGFSLPVAALVEIAPASGYEFVIKYKIGLPNPDGSTPRASRRLLQTQSTTTSTFVGNMRFTISVSFNSTGQPTGPPVVVVDEVTITSTVDRASATDAMTMGVVPSFLISVVFFAVLSTVSKDCNSSRL